MKRHVSIAFLLLACAPQRSSVEEHHQLEPEPHEITVLARDVEGSAPSWAPDGSAIVIGSATGGIVVVPVGGEPVQVVTRNPFHNGPTWAPTGGRIAFVDDAREDSKDVYVVDDLRNPKTLRIPLGGGTYLAELPWSPQGNSILYWTDTGDVGTIDVVDRKPKVIGKDEGICIRGGLSHLRWNRTGSITASGATSGVMILRGSESKWRCLSERSGRNAVEGPDGAVWWIADRSTLEVDRHGERMRIALDGDISSLDVNPRNGSAVVAVFKKGLFFVPSGGNKGSLLVPPSEIRPASGVGAERYPSDGVPVWSPDGTMVAFVRLEGPSSADLCVITVEE